MSLKDHCHLLTTLALSIFLHVMKWRLLVWEQKPDLSSVLFVFALIVSLHGLRNRNDYNPVRSILHMIVETIILLFVCDIVTYVGWELIGDILWEILFNVLHTIVGLWLRAFSPRIFLFTIRDLIYVLKIAVSVCAAYKALSKFHLSLITVRNVCRAIDVSNRVTSEPTNTKATTPQKPTRRGQKKSVSKRGRRSK